MEEPMGVQEIAFTPEDDTLPSPKGYIKVSNEEWTHLCKKVHEAWQEVESIDPEKQNISDVEENFSTIHKRLADAMSLMSTYTPNIFTTIDLEGHQEAQQEDDGPLIFDLDLD